MKMLLAAALAAFACSPAFAEKRVTVSVPSDLSNPAVARAYTNALMHAAVTVCTKETAPVIGLNYYAYKACLKATRRNIAASEPTGLLAARLGLRTSLAVASK